MPSFGEISASRLATCHNDLQVLFNEVIKYYDCQILYGHRTLSEQMEEYKKGRTYHITKKQWEIKNKFEIVTYCDGEIKKSKHNESPSLAVDVMPYPIEWKDKSGAAFFAGKVMEVYRRLKEEGKIKTNIRWGGDWNNNGRTIDEALIDYPHFEVYE